MTKPSYERPFLVRHESGLMNKFGRMRAMRPQREIDSVPVQSLVEQYGSPLFVFSENTLTRRFRELHQAFSLRHPKVRIAWSYKTNYLGGICRVFHREGAYAEVVSDFEYEKALSLGVEPTHIHFNGPMKAEPILEKALSSGSLVHIDHFDELALAERIAERLQITPGVAIRVNLSAEGVVPWSRFGFQLENGQAMDAVRRILAGKRLKLNGLHCHIGTFIQEADAYRDAAKKLAELANRIRDEHGVVLDFIDIGGGFASHNQLKLQYLPADQVTPSFARYAEAIADGWSHLGYPPDKEPTLVLETGRALVDDAGYLVSSVQANKRLGDGRRGVVLDAGVNTLFTSFWYNHELVPTRDVEGSFEPTVFFGPLCMNIDVVRETTLFPSVNPGDLLVFRNVGAYNVTQWMQFITYRPAVVLVGAGGKTSLLRRRESLETVCAPEVMPPWL